jgi:hypothetical protein
MKAKLKFNLLDPEQARAHMRCIKSLDMALAIFDISEVAYKLEDGKLRDSIFGCIEKNKIDLEELIE